MAITEDSYPFVHVGEELEASDEVVKANTGDSPRVVVVLLEGLRIPAHPDDHDPVRRGGVLRGAGMTVLCAGSDLARWPDLTRSPALSTGRIGLGVVRP